MMNAFGSFLLLLAAVFHASEAFSPSSPPMTAQVHEGVVLQMMERPQDKEPLVVVNTELKLDDKEGDFTNTLNTKQIQKRPMAKLHEQTQKSMQNQFRVQAKSRSPLALPK